MIAVVDDDVRFAEEIQDLLALHGHHSVVVVTHPHESSLDLLEHAKLLILDLSLAATTGLKVLEELRRRGSSPAVLMVSGSGEDALHSARSSAVAQGFSILGALRKPVEVADLVGLVDILGSERHGATFAPPPEAHIFASSSLAYAGAYFRPDLAAADSAGPLLEAATAARQVLASAGQYGFMVVRLPSETLLDPARRNDICDGFGHPLITRSRIVFELDRDVRANPLAHVAAMVDLRLAGYGLLLNADEADLRRLPAIADLPITIVAVDARIPALSPDAPDAAAPLKETIGRMRQRAVAALCTGLQSTRDLPHLRQVGFDFISRSAQFGSWAYR